MDEGSTVTIIDSKLAEYIGVVGHSDPLDLIGVGKLGLSDSSSQRVSFGISVPDGTAIHSVSGARTMRSLALPGQSLNRVEFQEYPHITSLPVEYYKYAEPKLLIGQDHWDLITPMQTYSTTRHAPAVSLTKLGWVIHGRLPTLSIERDDESHALVTREKIESCRDAESDANLHTLVKSSFSLEGLGVTRFNRRNKLEARAEHVLSTTARKVGTRWEVGLLWKNDNVNMPENRKSALSRLMSLEQKMDRDPEYGRRYCLQLKHLVDSGYAKKMVFPADCHPRAWYLPHFGTVSAKKPDKIRLVFDASAKTAGVSLNDNLLIGPDLVCSLLGVLMRFRQRKVAFMGDIREMFLQIKIREEDQNAQRFLWRGMDRHCDPDEYVMSSMIFGAASSPCTAQYVMNQNAREFSTQFPEAVNAIKNKHYVDDYLDSVDTVREGIQKIKEVSEIHRCGGFEITGWTSNSRNLLEALSVESRASGPVDISNDRLERALGMRWNPGRDNISFDLNLDKIPTPINDGVKSPTKREMLSVVMSVYDPLGMLLPFTIRGKILLQSVWRSGIGWDQRLKNEEFDRWKAWFDKLKIMDRHQIPRAYFSRAKPPGNLELHMFSDASDKAYSAVAYLRGVYNDGTVEVSFLAGKARVGPLKPLSVPRMELQGAVLASRLAVTIIQELELIIKKRTYWTDSRTVLGWIRTDPRKYSVFVSHRLGEIDESTNVSEWRWVPTKLNPADSATKEAGNVDDHMTTWLKGTPFLLSQESAWPRQADTKNDGPPKIEAKREVIVTLKERRKPPLPDIDHFSKWLCLIRSTAWVLLSPQRWRRISKPEPTAEDLRKAENLWNKKVQEDCFGTEMEKIESGEPLPKNSPLYALTPMMKRDEGVLRIDGRINAVEDVSDDTKSPIILHGGHRYTKMLIHMYHEKVGHASPETVVNEIRQKYWIIRLRPTVRKVASHCQWCRVQRSKPQIPRMGDLPIGRLGHHHRPFTYCGVDYFGPMMVTIGRRREKRWGVLLTCLTTRAVHLELAASLSTDSAIMALRRMMARRGQPTEMFSDNGTNMTGMNSELRKAMKDIDQDAVELEMTNRGIKWHFIPPATPHMGGSWERLVRSVKVALSVVLNSRAPKEEILQTLLTEVEQVVNSRPLTHVSVDPREMESLTPNHFLIGSSSGVAAPGRFTKDDLCLRKMWRKSQRLADMFWSRWVKEYLPNLVVRKRWLQDVRPLTEGDVVIVADPALPRNTWPKGIVTKVIPGKDGRIRMADVRTRSGIFRRSAANIVVLVPATEST